MHTQQSETPPESRPENGNHEQEEARILEPEAGGKAKALCSPYFINAPKIPGAELCAAISSKGPAKK